MRVALVLACVRYVNRRLGSGNPKDLWPARWPVSGERFGEVRDGILRAGRRG